MTPKSVQSRISRPIKSGLNLFYNKLLSVKSGAKAFLSNPKLAAILTHTSETKNNFLIKLSPTTIRKIESFCVLLPGLFFILIGVSALLAPKFLLPMLAGFCISFGVLFCFFSLKFLALKRKFMQFSHQIEARLIIDPGKVRDLNNIESPESKKVVYH